MEAFCAVILILAAVALVGVMVWQARRGTVDLLSVRNFFLLGFILFQLVSGAFSLWTGIYGDVRVTDHPRVAFVYTIAAISFAVLLLWVYRWRWPAGAIASRLASDTTSPAPASMLVLAYAFLALGMAIRFTLVYIPFFGIFAAAVGNGLILVAVAMTAWAWTPRLWNPAIALAAAPIFLVALFSVLTGNFGRRDTVAFVGAAAWGAYHGHWKQIGFRAAVPGLGVVAAVGLVLFGAVTATRQVDVVYSPGEVLGRLTSRSPLQGLVDLTNGQLAGANSMYLIQTRPADFEYDTLHTARYTIFHPVPRPLWPEKPVGLGLTLPDEVHVRNVSKNLTLGVGLLGHMWNDNPWLAFPLYTLVIGLTLRFLDELIRRSPSNPFVVLPIAVGIGEIVGIPRGEAGLFYVRAVAYTLGAWVAMALVARLFRSLGWVQFSEPWNDTGAEEHPDDGEPGAWDETHEAAPEPGAWDAEPTTR